MTAKTILVVDDSQTDLMALKETLADTGATIVSATSGAQAVQKAKNERPDLIFMDIVMADMNGYEACRAIKEDAALAHIPIIFVSSKHQKADHIWAKRQGGEALVGKPYTKEQIIEHIQSLS